MFERYSESARRALFFARYEVSQLGATEIDTEHLLLGLIREPHVRIARLLASWDLTAEGIRQDLEARVAARARIPTSVEIPFSAAVRRILQYAAQEADQVDQHDIRPVHLLAALLREEGSVAASMLTSHGAGLDAVRRAIVEPGSGPPSSSAGTLRGCAERIEDIRRLVQALTEASSDTGERRQLAERIGQELDVLKEQVRGRR
jgi:ATP-dependent Clp protease ATP-binding subunit ClpC